MNIQTNEIKSCVKWIKVVELYRLTMTFYSLKHYYLFLMLLLHRFFKANINHEIFFIFSDNTCFCTSKQIRISQLLLLILWTKMLLYCIWVCFLGPYSYEIHYKTYILLCAYTRTYCNSNKTFIGYSECIVLNQWLH